MAEGSSSEATGNGIPVGQSSNATIEIKLKTLDSQMYTFQVERDMPIPALKEKIRLVTEVPVEHQRLICRGKVLKDDQCLSDYNIEDGHTLHLVPRQPPSQSTSTAATTEGSSEQGDGSSGSARNRIGQVSQNIVFGSINLQDQTAGGMPDLNRILSSVMNSIGLGNPPAVNNVAGNGATAPGANNAAGNGSTPSVQNDGQQGSTQNQQQNENVPSEGSSAGSQHQPGIGIPNIPIESLFNNFATMAIPQQMVVPDALTTLSLYLSRLEQAYLQHGFQSNSNSTATAGTGSQDPNTVPGEPSASRSLLSPASLGSIIQRVQQLLSGPAGTSFSQLARQLEGESALNDLSVRSQIQSSSLWNGMIMQELGSLLLELGRATMTLRMGQSHEESMVNAGPAVYISPIGPNPIMVQPQSFHRNGIFGGPNPIIHPNMGVGGGPFAAAGDVSRNVSIHIHAGAPTIASVNPQQGSQANPSQAAGQTDQAGNNNSTNRSGGSVRVVPVRTVVTAVPTRPPHEQGNSGALNAFYPVLGRLPQMNLSQGAPTSSVNQTAAGGTPIIQSQQPESVQMQPVVTHVQVHAQVGNADGQTMSGFSLPNMFSVPISANSMQGATQPGTTGQGASQNQRTNGNDNPVNRGQESLGTNNADNGTVLSNNEMSNFVTSIMQQMMGGYRSGGTQNQEEPVQRNASSGLSATNEPPAQDVRNLCDNNSNNTRENATSEVEGGDVRERVAAMDIDKQEENLTSATNKIDSSTSSGSKNDAQSLSQPEGQHSSNQTTAPMGLGGLQPLPSKPPKQNRKQKSVKTSTHDKESTQNSEALAMGQNVLQAIASQHNSNGSRPATQGNPLAGLQGLMDRSGQSSNGGIDVQNIASQLFQNPDLSNIMRGVSSQLASMPPDVLSNMEEQLSSVPGMSSTMQQMAEQLGGSMEPSAMRNNGLEGRQGGLDFSALLQQFGPIISQVIGRPSVSSGIPSVPSERQQLPSSTSQPTTDDLKIDFESTIQHLENGGAPEEIFRTMLERALAIVMSDSSVQDDLSDLLSWLPIQDLANEYLDLLERHMMSRLQSN